MLHGTMKDGLESQHPMRNQCTHVTVKTGTRICWMGHCVVSQCRQLRCCMEMWMRFCFTAVLARESFQVKIKKEIAGFQVDGTGIWINGRYPGMSASPGGIVFDPISDAKGVLEIKCPMALKAIDPNKFDECLTVKRLAAFWSCKQPTPTTMKFNYRWQCANCSGIICRVDTAWTALWKRGIWCQTCRWYAFQAQIISPKVLMHRVRPD